MTMRSLTLGTVLAVAFSFAWLGAPGEAVAQAKTVKCRMTYDVSGWSIIYRRQTGTGKVTCSNGQTANVRISTHGGGATFGTSTADGGRGTFAAVRDISDVYGGYFEVAAHGAAGAGGDARAMFNGRTSLSLAGSGGGIGFGVAFGYFGIHKP